MSTLSSAARAQFSNLATHLAYMHTPSIIPAGTPTTSYMTRPQMENFANLQYAAITPQAGTYIARSVQSAPRPLNLSTSIAHFGIGLMMGAPQDLDARLKAPCFRRRMHYVSMERREAFLDQTFLDVPWQDQLQRLSVRHCMQLSEYPKFRAMEAFEAFVLQSTKTIWCFTCLQGNVVVPGNWPHDNCPQCQMAQLPHQPVRNAPSLAGPATRVSFSTPSVVAPCLSPAMTASISRPAFPVQQQPMLTPATHAGPVKVYNFNERSPDTMGHKSWNAMNRPSFQSPAVQRANTIISGPAHGQWQNPAAPDMRSGPTFTQRSGMMPPSPVFTPSSASPAPTANKSAMPGSMRPKTPQGSTSAQYTAYVRGQMTPPTPTFRLNNARHFRLLEQRMCAPSGPSFDPPPGLMPTQKVQRAPTASSRLGLGLSMARSPLIGNKRKVPVEVVESDAQTPRKRTKTSFPPSGHKVIDLDADAPAIKRIDSFMPQKSDQIIDLTRKTPPIQFPNAASARQATAVAAPPANTMPPPPSPPPANNRPNLSAREFGPKWMQQLPNMAGMLKSYIEQCMRRAGPEVDAYIKKHHTLPPLGRFDEDKEKILDHWFFGVNYAHQRKVAAAKKAGPPKPGPGFKVVQLPDAEDGMPQWKSVALTSQEELEQHFGEGAEVQEDGTVWGPLVTDPNSGLEGYRSVLAVQQHEWYATMKNGERESTDGANKYDWSEEMEADFARKLQAEIAHLRMPPRVDPWENGGGTIGFNTRHMEFPAK